MIVSGILNLVLSCRNRLPCRHSVSLSLTPLPAATASVRPPQVRGKEWPTADAAQNFFITGRQTPN